MIKCLLISPFALPFLGGCLSFFFRSQLLSTLVVFMGMVGALVGYGALLFFPCYNSLQLFPWLKLPQTQVFFEVQWDWIAFFVGGIILGVSFFIHVYSLTYMKTDKNRPFFLALLSLLTAAIVLLLVSFNIFQFFLAWEGVGIFSCLLIGFWTHKKAGRQAALKIFMTNCIGDVGFVLGLASLVFFWGGVHFHHLKGFSNPFISNVTALLFFWAIAERSAQTICSLWFCETTEAPVSAVALIHSFGMLASGIFLIFRLKFLFVGASLAQDILILTGLLTAFSSAIFSMTQTDLKKILAFSTSSQLGLVIAACGAGAFSFSFCYFVLHALLKALIFLTTGSVIHAMSQEQDIQKMGGLYRFIPQTYILTLTASFGLMTIPFLGEYFSGQSILGFFSKSHLLFFLLTSILNAGCMGRIIFKVFHGRPQSDEKTYAYLQEVSLGMLIPSYSICFIFLASCWILCGHFVKTDGAYPFDKTFWLATMAVFFIIFVAHNRIFALFGKNMGVLFGKYSLGDIFSFTWRREKKDTLAIPCSREVVNAQNGKVLWKDIFSFDLNSYKFCLFRFGDYHYLYGKYFIGSYVLFFFIILNIFLFLIMESPQINLGVFQMFKAFISEFFSFLKLLA